MLKRKVMGEVRNTSFCGGGEIILVEGSLTSLSRLYGKGGMKVKTLGWLEALA
jgi:hypothetical protein